VQIRSNIVQIRSSKVGRPPGATDRAARRFLWMMALLVSFAVAFFVTPLHTLFSTESVTVWRTWIEQTGAYAPLFFLLVLAGSALAGIPRMYPTILGGALFAVFPAVVLAVVGSTLGALGTFAFARFMGRDYVKRRIRGRFRGLDERIERNGLELVVLLRLLPFGNFVLTNFACGVTSIRSGDYVAATSIGMIPSTVLFVLIGRGLGNHDRLLVATSTGVFVVVTALALAAYRRFFATPVPDEQ